MPDSKHREKYRARRRLEAAMDRLVAASEEDQEAADGELGAAINGYAQLFLEEDDSG